MSSGAFLDANYTDNNDITHAIRIQPETAALVIDGVTNTIPALPAGGNLPPQVKVSGGKGQRGITARRVGVRFGATPPAGYLSNSTHYVVWLQPDTFPDPSLRQTGTYLGASVTLIGQSPERKR